MNQTKINRTALINCLEAELREAARSTPPPNAKKGDWVEWQLERTYYHDILGNPTGWITGKSGPYMWVPRWRVLELVELRETSF